MGHGGGGEEEVVLMRQKKKDPEISSAVLFCQAWSRDSLS